MNIVIAGDGEVGFHLANRLSKIKHKITVIDPNTELLKLLEQEADLLTISGNSTSVETLREARVDNCDMMIAVLHHESINILTCILAKQLGAKKTVCRVATQEYLDKNREMFVKMGIDEMVCPEKLAAREIELLLTRNITAPLFNFSDKKLCIYMLKIDERSPFCNKTLIDVAKLKPDLDIRTVCIVRRGQTIIPNGEQCYLPNDIIYLIATPDRSDNIKFIAGRDNITLSNAMIVGGGRVGRRTLDNLHDKLSLKLIEKDMDVCNRLANDFDDVMIINGNGSDINLLEQENIAQADAFVSLTASTETNIMSCLYAARKGVKRTVAMVENINYIDLSQDIGIGTIINKKLIAASYIIRFTIEGEVMASKWLSGIEAEVIELEAKPKSKITKYCLKDTSLPRGVNIGGVIRQDNRAFIAGGDTKIEAGDKVIAFTIPESAEKFIKMFS